MSNEREIRLTGVFKDDITPKLQRLNKQIAATVRQFERLQKRLRPIAKEMGVLAMASERIGNSLRAQRTGFESNIRAMRAYRSEMGRTVAAQRRLTGRTALPQITAAPRVRPSGGTKGGFAGGGGGGGGSAYVHPTQRMSRGGVASTYAPSAQRMPSGGGGVGIADGAAGAAFGITLGNQIGSIMTNAVMTGFHKGVELMQKPFKFLAHEFRHAMQEEMADITAAGAMFALDKAGKTGMFKDFEDARMAQEMLDQRLALSAGRLPGETLQYVQQARQLQDTIMQAMGRDKEGFIKHAEKLGAVPGDMRDAFATVLAQFTERAVLLGMGGGGTGGLGVPQLLEQMVGQEAVRVQSMGMRYSALRTNPLLKAALERNEAAINATTVGTIERINAIQKALDEALPQEVITAMTMTMNGIAEGFRSSIFDIAAGWFGVRRMMKGVEAATYKMSGEIKQATNSTLSLFDVLRDTIGFFVVPLLELTSILPEIYEPFEGLVNTLVPLRAIGARFTFTFNQFAADYEAFAKEAFPDDFDKQTAFLKNRGPRAALRSIAALLEDFDPGFSADEVSRELLKVDADFGKVAKDMITSLLDSDFMEMVGETMGNFVSELLTVMANLVTGATDFATTSRFAKGFSKGLQGRLDEAGNKLGMGAFEAVRKIFEGVFRVMGRLLLTIVTQLPMETMLFVGITAVLPAALAALGTKIGMTLSAVLGKVGGMIQASLIGSARGARGVQGPMPTAAGTTGLRAAGAAKQAIQQNTGALGRIGTAVPGVSKGMGAAKGALGAVVKGGKMKGIGLAAAGIVKLSTMGPQMAKLGKFATNFGKNIPYLNVAFAGLDLAARKAEGQDTSAAVAGAGGGLVGSIIGGAIGTMILPGVGTAIGGVLGSLLGSWVGEKLPEMLEGIGPAMQGAWTGLTNFFTETIPSAWNFAISSATEVLSTVWNSLTNFFTQTIPSLWNSAVSFVTDALSAAWNGLVNFIKSIPGLILTGLKTLEKFFVEDVPFAISFAIGYAIQTLENVWDSLVHFFTVTIPTAWAAGLNFVKNVLNTVWTGLVEFFTVAIPTAWTAAMNFAKTVLQAIWNGLVQFFTVTLPSAWTAAVTFVQRVLTEAWSALTAFFFALPEMMAAAWASLVAWARSLPETIGKAFASFISYVATIPGKISDALGQVAMVIIDWVRGIPGRVMGALGRGFEAGKKVAGAPQPTAPSTAPKFGFNAAGGNFNTPLGKAISSEMRHKPPGSDLVIANSSETIIPAARGNGDISSIVSPLEKISSQSSRTSEYLRQTLARLSTNVPVRVTNSPTVKFDMGGGMGPIGGGIGGFPKTSGYGMRWGKMHQGNDYAMPVGTKLGIGGPGKVLGAGYWGGYGNAMDIGGPGGMVYRFAHLSKFLAPVGASLPPGMPFALSGNTGMSTGPHLHFEARPGGGGPVNPDAFAGIIRANFAGTALGPLMGAMGTEMKNMPYGAQLAVANSDEIFMKPKQMAHVIESSARAGAEGTGNITTGPITINVDGYDKDPRELTEIIASQLVTAMYRQSRSEVLTS
jgi:murein DD-endopeptidase MepM/ murein hydrolase activator NlpD